ncbi:MAG: hypothetical protein ACXVQU_04085 [Actinomycetota bacterium]
MSGFGYLIAAYVGAALLYGLYTFRVLRRERALERNIRDGEPR